MTFHCKKNRTIANLVSKAVADLSKIPSTDITSCHWLIGIKSWNICIPLNPSFRRRCPSPVPVSTLSFMMYLTCTFVMEEMLVVFLLCCELVSFTVASRIAWLYLWYLKLTLFLCFQTVQDRIRIFSRWLWKVVLYHDLLCQVYSTNQQMTY